MPVSSIVLSSDDYCNAVAYSNVTKRYYVRGQGPGYFDDKKSSRLELRKHFVNQRIVDHWNKLPDDVVSAATISSFKKRLDIWMERYGH